MGVQCIITVFCYDKVRFIIVKLKKQHIFIFTYFNLIKMNILRFLPRSLDSAHYEFIHDGSDVNWSKNMLAFITQTWQDEKNKATLTSGVFYL